MVDIVRGGTGALQKLPVPALSIDVVRSRLLLLRKSPTLKTSSYEMFRMANTIVKSYDRETLRRFTWLIRKRPDLPAEGNVYAKIIQGCIQHKRLLNALSMYRMMFHREVKPTQNTLAMLISGLAANKQKDLALDIYHHLEKWKLAPEIGVLNSLLSIRATDGDVPGMKRVLLRMKKLSFAPSLVTYTCLIRGYTNAKDIDSVNQVWEAMAKKEVKPDAVAWVAYVKAWSQLKNAKHGEEALRQCPDKSADAWNAVIAAHARERNQGGAGALFNEMVESGVQPNVHTFNALMRICEPKSVFARMDLHDVEPEASTFAVLMSRYAQLGDLESAVLTFREMKKRGVRPDDSALLAVAGAFGSAGKISSVKKILRKREVKDAKTLNLILFAHTRNKDPLAAVADFQKLSRKIKPDRTTYRHLVTAHIQAEDAMGAELAFKEMQDRGFKPNVAVLYDMIELRYRAGDAVGMLALYDQSFQLNIGGHLLRESVATKLQALGLADSLRGFGSPRERRGAEAAPASKTEPRILSGRSSPS